MERLTWDYDEVYNLNLQFINIKKGRKFKEEHINSILAFDIETSNGFRQPDGRVIPYSHKVFNDFLEKARIASTQGLFLGDKPKEYANPVSLMYVWQCAVESGDDIVVFMGRTWGDFIKFINTLNDAIKSRYVFGHFYQPMAMDERDYFNYSISSYNKKVDIHLYVHNLSFEFQHLQNTGLQFKGVFAREMRKPMKAITELSHLRITFHDTLSLTQKSLAAWGKDENLPVQKQAAIDYLKILTPISPLSDETIKYCAADVVTMIYGMKKYRAKYDDKLTEIPMTQTGEVRIVCRKEISAMNRNWAEECYTVDHSYEFEFYKKLLYAFAGGWTHANQKYANKLMKNVVCYDFASSYPSVMTTAKFPMGKSKQIDAARIAEIDKTPIDDRDVIYMLTVDVHDFTSNIWNSFWSASKIVKDDDGNALCEDLFLDNGKIISGKYARITMTDLDWDVFRKAYDIKNYDIVDAYEWKADYLPMEMILTILNYYADKTSLKGTGQDSKYNAAKQFINSIYGCCVTKIITDEIDFNNGWNKSFITEEEFIEKMSIPEKPAAIEKGINQAFTTYQAGVWVTAWARHRLFDMILKLDDKVVYCDTDSIKGVFDANDIALFDDYNQYIGALQQRVADHYQFDVGMFTCLTSKGKSKQLGIFEREEDCREFKTIGAKRYACEHVHDDGTTSIEITIAGLPKSAGHHHIKKVDDLCNNIYWTPEESGKLMAHYNDDQQPCTWADDEGNSYDSADKYGIMLEPIGFDLSLAAEYDELLKFLAGYDCDYYHITKIFR